MSGKVSIRSELFFLRQFGFSEKTLDLIYLSGEDPIAFLFNYIIEESSQRGKFLTKKEKELAYMYEEYLDFKIKLFKDDPLLVKNDTNKIFFKYDDHMISSLIPLSIRPLFMYAKGDISFLSDDYKRIAVIGTRNPSDVAKSKAKKLTKWLINDNYVIVSGLAEGIDTITHEVTLDNNGKTIAVLPTNFNKIYPIENTVLAKSIMEKGLLLSAVGPNENTYKSSFLDRNQYVAYISDAVLVIETNLKSGTMNTIRNASEAEKPIYFINQNDKLINKKIKNFGGIMIDG